DAWRARPVEVGLIADPNQRFRPSRSGPEPNGNALLAYLLMVLRHERNVSRFCSDTSIGEWRLCGFDSPPDEATLNAQFVELERWPEIIAAARRYLVSLAKAQYPATGDIVTVDATPWVSPARLIHCCPDPAMCARLTRSRRALSPGEEPMMERRWEESTLPEP